MHSYCTSFLLLYNKLTQPSELNATQICGVTVSMGQESSTFSWVLDLDLLGLNLRWCLPES